MFEWQETAWKAWTPLRERLPHAILLQAGEGWGELDFALSAAQSLLCENPRADSSS